MKVTDTFYFIRKLIYIISMLVQSFIPTVTNIGPDEYAANIFNVSASLSARWRSV